MLYHYQYQIISLRMNMPQQNYNEFKINQNAFTTKL